jgi:hypothetical protein
MDIDAMWQQFVKFRPMLDDLYLQWTSYKENEERLAKARFTPDGRVMTEEEIAANDATAVARPIAGHFVTVGAHPQVADSEPFEPDSEEELTRLREIAEERGVDIDPRWKSKRLRQEMDMDEDEPVYPAPETPQPTEPPKPGEGVTASGSGGQANPAGHGSTASGSGGQANDPGPGATASGSGGQNNPPGEQGQVSEPQTGSRGMERGSAQTDGGDKPNETGMKPGSGMQRGSEAKSDAKSETDTKPADTKPADRSK